MSIKGLYQTDYETYIVVQVEDTVYSGEFPRIETVVDKKLAIPSLIALVVASRGDSSRALPIIPGTETGAFDLDFGTKGMNCKIHLAKYVQSEIIDPPVVEVKSVV